MRRTPIVVLAVLLAASTAVMACGSDKNGTASPSSASASGSASAPADTDKTHATFDAAAATTKVTVKAVEFSYQVTPAQAVGPKVFFEVTNGGTINHELEIVGLDGRTVDEIGEFKPGETKTLAVDMPAGTYVLQCLLVKDGQTHA